MVSKIQADKGSLIPKLFSPLSGRIAGMKDVPLETLKLRVNKS